MGSERAEQVVPVVSVITSCYRPERYLDAFLANVAEQSIFESIELCIDLVMPASSEVDRVKSWAERAGCSLKLLISTRRTTVGESMNRCIRASTGSNLAIWNVDDTRTPDSLEILSAALESSPHSSIAFGPHVETSVFGRRTGKLVDVRPYSHDQMLTGMLLGPFFMARRSLLGNAGMFDEQFRSGADFDFAMRAVRWTDPICVSREVGFYTNEGVGLSTSGESNQGLESTVIALRYGIWDKVDLRHLKASCDYSIPLMKWGNEWHRVSEFLPSGSHFVGRRDKSDGYAFVMRSLAREIRGDVLGVGRRFYRRGWSSAGRPK